VSQEPRAQPRGAPRRRLGGSLAVAAVLVAAGLLFAVSARTAGGTELRADRADLPALIRAEQARVETRSEQVANLRQQVDADTERVSTYDSTVARLQRQIDAEQPLAGLAPVRGPALRVTLNDAPRNLPVPAQAHPDDLVVHQQDVQAVVNAMWAGGAEAVMLQDQRVIATSAVRCVGNTLILQGRVYSPPYTVTAMGDVAGMRRALDDSPDIIIYKQYVDAYGLGWDEHDLGTATFPAFAGPLAMRYVRQPAAAAPTASSTSSPLAASPASSPSLPPGPSSGPPSTPSHSPLG